VKTEAKIEDTAKDKAAVSNTAVSKVEASKGTGGEEGEEGDEGGGRLADRGTPPRTRHTPSGYHDIDGVNGGIDVSWGGSVQGGVTSGTGGGSWYKGGRQEGRQEGYGGYRGWCQEEEETVSTLTRFRSVKERVRDHIVR
jgi:hypothetical protein